MSYQQLIGFKGPSDNNPLDISPDRRRISSSSWGLDLVFGDNSLRCLA